MFLFTEEHRQEIESQSAQMISEFRSELDSKKIYIAELEQRIQEFTLPTEGHDHVIIQIQLKFSLVIKTEACHMKHSLYHRWKYERESFTEDCISSYSTKAR